CPAGMQMQRAAPCRPLLFVEFLWRFGGGLLRAALRRTRHGYVPAGSAAALRRAARERPWHCVLAVRAHGARTGPSGRQTADVWLETAYRSLGPGLPALGPDDVVADGEAGQLRHRADLQLALDLRAVVGDGLVAERKALGDLAGVESLGQQAADLELARGQARERAVPVPHLLEGELLCQ